ncbi:class I SAM-dependent methyltransferase [Anatilimnocola floriformis]|uniref:class I SAM-dependent methyltransferase n=1 Tax=Anatilimnocola floriformis TaxID=2948575 RepID=UPI0020C38491|nr:class I SAM-dependent methyltransferase [Anatilimnocola floriformis]
MEDHHWLTSAAAQPLLEELQQKLRAAGQVDVRLAASLRKSHSATRTHLLLEQVELRNRARDKFADPSAMFFTRKGLEQCTDEALAGYKAARFPQGSIADLCCGIGGDALALARRGPVSAWDADATTAHYAECNLKLRLPENAQVHAQIAAAEAVAEVAAWHMDPDRRATGERTIELSDYEPGPELLREMLQKNPHAAVKIAPAAEVNPSEWPPHERQWLGSRGECRQQVLWFGELAQHAHQHVATVVASGGEVTSFVGDANLPFQPADAVLQYIYEPDAAVLAAQLAGAMAAEHDLAAITAGGGYLTADHQVNQKLLTAFRVRDVLPYDLRKLKAYCREHQLGQLEIKKRGVELQPHYVRRQILAAGENAAVIFVTPVGDQVKAIVAERVLDPLSSVLRGES